MIIQTVRTLFHYKHISNVKCAGLDQFADEGLYHFSLFIICYVHLANITYPLSTKVYAKLNAVQTEWTQHMQ